MNKTVSSRSAFPAEFGHNKEIYRAGEPSGGKAFEVLSGIVHLFLTDDKGRKTCVGLVQANETFGEEAVFGCSRHHTAAAYKRASIKAIDLSLLTDRSRTLSNQGDQMAWMQERWTAYPAECAKLLLHAQARLHAFPRRSAAREVLGKVRLICEQYPDLTTINPNSGLLMGTEMVADLAVCSREIVSRVLKANPDIPIKKKGMNKQT